MSDTERRPAAPGPEEEENSFLSRWSRRKLQPRETAPERPEAGPPDTRPREVDPGVAGSSAGEPVASTSRAPEPPPREPTDEDMPALESLHQDADVSMFFSPKVSPQLRRQALRKLFHTPKFNIRDGLDDFDEDYTYFAPLGDTVTADMRYMKDVAERRARELAEREARAQHPVVAEQPPPADPQAVETSVRTQASDTAGTPADAETRARPDSDASPEERSA